jgi:hypothetical protein
LIQNTIELEELEERVNKFLKNERILSFMTSIVYWAFFAVLIPAIILNNVLQVASWITWTVAGVTTAIWFLIAFKIRGRVLKFKVEDNEWATYYSHLILEGLDKRSRAKNEDLKKEYQNEAIKNARNFLSCIIERWKIGSFKLVQNVFKKPLDELKKNLQYRIIPALKDGTQEELEKVEAVMRNLFYQSKNLKLDDIIALNEQMAKLPSREPLKVGYRNRIANYMNVHRVQKNVLLVSAFALVSCVFYYLTVTYVGIAKEVVFPSTVVLFVGLITVYYRRQPKV